ncbi:MAG: PQQ-dependent dehydrogenase, methanol/ethanol family [Gammaproteobacteria bacterium]|nr:PQQ-dependent dehydrogenase, methanol/ethanol family [Gammaproteobacteria bacterium]
MANIPAPHLGSLSAAVAELSRAWSIASVLCVAIVAVAAGAPLNDARIGAATAEPGSWPSHGRTWSEQRFSTLTDINRSNVASLGLDWHFETGSKRGMEATPIVVDGVMYVTAAWSKVFALDAATGQEIWRYDPKVAGAKGRDACCDVVNRGVAVYGERVYVGALDGRLIALERKSGQPVWSVQTTDTTKPYTITGAPRVLKGMVIIGNGGAEFGVRGYFSAYDAATGALRWRFYTVPPAPALPVEHPALEAARRTWSPDSLWETGLGGTVWDSFAYDPDLDLLYAGVGNGSQYNRAQRSPGGGDNLYLASILAVRPDTGALVWHYQTTPAESWDYTATQHMVLADLTIAGRERKVLMQAPKNGFFYVLDRATGELLSARNYVPVNWASHVDLETGRPVETGAGDWSQTQKYVTPSIVGGHNWHPMAWSPSTQLMYIPTIHAVYPFKPDPDFRYDPRTMNTGEDWPGLFADLPPVQPRFCAPTRLTAWDPVAARSLWEVDHRSGVPAGVLATAGGIVVQGTTAGELVAYDDRDGKELARIATGVGIMAPPITYALGGTQYIAVVAGIGGAQGGHAHTLSHENPGQVLAFRLGGTAAAPSPKPLIRNAAVAETPLDESAVLRGRSLYATHCLRCHGAGAASSGVYPDLRFSAPGVHELWQQIVREGLFEATGMAGFDDVLTQGDVNDIHAYVIERALTSQSVVSRIANTVAQAVCVPAEWLAD